MTDGCVAQRTGEARNLVRLAQYGDVWQLAPMLLEFSQFASLKYPLYPDDDQMAMEIITGLMTYHPFYVSTIQHQGGGEKVTGCICGIVSNHLFNPKLRVLSEAFWWVDPAYRSTRAGLQLLEALTVWAKQNVDMFVMTLENISPVKPATLEKRGFRKRETNFILEV